MFPGQDDAGANHGGSCHSKTRQHSIISPSLSYNTVGNATAKRNQALRLLFLFVNLSFSDLSVSCGIMGTLQGWVAGAGAG